MSGHRSVAHVAAWEFRRYVKPKQQVAGFVITLLMLLGFSWLSRRGAEPSIVEVAVVGAENLPALPPESGRFRFERHDPAALPGLLVEIERRDRDAVVVIDGDGGGSLHARQAPTWRGDLERELTAIAQATRFERSSISPEQIAAITAPFRLTVQETAPRAGRAERIGAMAAIGLAMIGLFSGIGYIFASVTGEKQNRLSEQIISTIPPQSWIDGKIIGLAAVSLVAILNFMIAGGVFLLLSRLLWDATIPLPTSIMNPGLLLLTFVFVGLGFLFWFAFLTATAAIVDDPHTSTRTQLLFLPMLAFVPAFVAVPDADATWVRVLAILPPTSSGLMPVRLLVTEVPLLEVAAALVLLIAAIWAARRAAGKVFRLGMLMYGKEPSWSEVRRWIRET